MACKFILPLQKSIQTRIKSLQGQMCNVQFEKNVHSHKHVWTITDFSGKAVRKPSAVAGINTPAMNGLRRCAAWQITTPHAWLQAAVSAGCPGPCNKSTAVNLIYSRNLILISLPSPHHHHTHICQLKTIYYVLSGLTKTENDWCGCNNG